MLCLKEFAREDHKTDWRRVNSSVVYRGLPALDCSEDETAAEDVRRNNVPALNINCRAKSD